VENANFKTLLYFLSIYKKRAVLFVSNQINTVSCISWNL